MKKLILFASCVALLGAGCVFERATSSPSISAPITEQTTEAPIAQRNGFGDIPPSPIPPRKPGVQGSVRLHAEFPSLPPNSTVLRIRSGQPSAPELQNIAQALQLPQGTIGRNPVTQELLLSWKDDEGRVWTYNGDEGLIHLSNSVIRNADMGGVLFHDDVLKDHAIGFLRSIGAELTRIGNPYIDEGASDSKIAVIRFNAKQDGQGIWSENGSARIGATIEIQRMGGRILEGSLMIRQDPDRSDYPTRPQETVQKQLAQGGLTGTPNGDVVIDEISFEWLQVTNHAELNTTFLYPAIIGNGIITYPDKRTAPYRIVVSLVE
ncbi:MAG: hypothetical protein NUV81_03080 [bacterium]|nr:hypothetical protein [bacterium]